jgi:protein farnesyltransferase/geranylgeranyltransferase type-1 subunit alpha
MDFNDNQIEKCIEEWEKVINPVPQFSDKVKILKIKYTKQDTKLMDIFRAVLLSKEISYRVYELTSLIISFFPTNYNAWVLRRQCLDKVKEIDALQELNWLDEMMVENQKNYQIWHHRKLLIEKINNATHEKKILNDVFEYEPKNFHAWTHRIWMIRRFNNVEGEFEFIDSMLKNDIKNNSVWNYRFFLIQYINKNLNKDKITEEIKYALEKIKLCPNNECPYCYIRGFITKFGYKYSDFSFVKETLEKIVQKNEVSFALMFLMDYYEEEKNENKFNEMIEKLVKIDFIRKKYYGWRKENSIFKKNK